MSKLDNKNISKHLGQSSQYKSEYDASLLVREPRSSNRKHLGIKEKSLPFIGCDVWNGYEVSALTNNGVPVCGVAKVVYPSDSKYIVESKSMKLYWNTFNMTKMGDTFDKVVKNLEETASKDLSKYLQTDVRVTVFPASDTFSNDNPYTDKNYKRLENTDEIDAESYYVDVYSETASLLETKHLNSTNKPYKVMSSLLKSNCRVTSQPDWGDVFISLEGTRHPSDKELLKYIISFRDECHFHEEICETIFTRLNNTFEPRSLMVACLYVRRGGWDINPIRTTHEYLIDEFFWDHKVPWIKTLRQ
jgi:7-cyano-7-deazaguanine reductase